VDTEDLVDADLLGADLVDTVAFLAATTGCLVCLVCLTAPFFATTLRVAFDGGLFTAEPFLAELPPVALEAEPAEPAEVFFVAGLADDLATVLAGTDFETVDLGRDARVPLTWSSARPRKVVQR
jgi:hypothetical protein